MPPKRSSVPIAEEWHGTRLVQLWGGDVGPSGSTGHAKQPWQDIITRTFLPEGFPSSVTTDYLGEWGLSFP